MSAWPANARGPRPVDPTTSWAHQHGRRRANIGYRTQELPAGRVVDVEHVALNENGKHQGMRITADLDGAGVVLHGNLLEARAFRQVVDPDFAAGGLVSVQIDLVHDGVQAIHAGVNGELLQSAGTPLRRLFFRTQQRPGGLHGETALFRLHRVHDSTERDEVPRIAHADRLLRNRVLFDIKHRLGAVAALDLAGIVNHGIQQRAIGANAEKRALAGGIDQGATRALDLSHELARLSVDNRDALTGIEVVNQQETAVIGQLRIRHHGQVRRTLRRNLDFTDERQMRRVVQGDDVRALTASATREISLG